MPGPKVRRNGDGIIVVEGFYMEVLNNSIREIYTRRMDKETHLNIRQGPIAIYGKRHEGTATWSVAAADARFRHSSIWPAITIAAPSPLPAQPPPPPPPDDPLNLVRRCRWRRRDCVPYVGRKLPIRSETRADPYTHRHSFLALPPDQARRSRGFLSRPARS